MAAAWLKAIPWGKVFTFGLSAWRSRRDTRAPTPVDGPATPARCARCGMRAESAIHATTSRVMAIRDAAHAFEPIDPV